MRGYQVGSLGWSLENNNKIGKIISNLTTYVQRKERKQPDKRNVGDR